MRHQSKYENLTYMALWGMLFVAPLMSLYIRTVSHADMEFDWQEVWMVWRQFGIYLLLFLLHNFILAPLLVYQQKRWRYISLSLCMLIAFTAFQCSQRPDEMRHHKPLPMEMRGSKGHHMKMGDRMDDEPPHFNDDESPARRNRPPHRLHNKKFGHRPPAFIDQHDIIAIVIVILMCGMNLGVKLYFKSRGDQKRLIELEKENLEQQLEYLKYQINPHFFMNTLNNIHALVDIDPEKAKDTILELSKMMRFVLYEGNKKGVPLSREFDFIRNYITLMKLRYTDKVRIHVDLPTEAPDRVIPPLMLITFIENAFKHGISYQRDSFIEVKVSIEHGRLIFTCRNSKADKPNQEKGGVGLTNVKQRLNLLYDNNFTLDIQDEPDIYNVTLNIPLS